MNLSVSYATISGSNLPVVVQQEKNVQNEQVETQGLSIGIAVFVAGIIVGYVVDEVFIYATGHSVGELTAAAIRKIVNFANSHFGLSYITYNKSTGFTGGGYGGGGGGAWNLVPHVI
ncbi:MAG: hypothetical protein RSF67_07830 [Clostridia bacterium]